MYPNKCLDFSGTDGIAIVTSINYTFLANVYVNAACQIKRKVNTLPNSHDHHFHHFWHSCLGCNQTKSCFRLDEMQIRVEARKFCSNLYKIRTII